jgi:hypothetical protein
MNSSIDIQCDEKQRLFLIIEKSANNRHLGLDVSRNKLLRMTTISY